MSVEIRGNIVVSLGDGYVESLYPVSVVYKDLQFIIPEGTKSNFASIPWFGRAFISPVDADLMRASFIHDALVGEFGPAMTDWHTAAKVLREVMKSTPCSGCRPGKSKRSTLHNLLYKNWRRFKRAVVYQSVMLYGITTGRAAM